MATINDLAKSITELDDDAAFKLIKDRRFSRRVQKTANKKATKKIAAKKPKKINIASAMSLLSPEQKAQLIKELGG